MEQEGAIYYKKIIDKAKEIDYYKLCATFLICGFVGWVFETVVVYFVTGQFSGRGYTFVAKPLAYYLPILANVPLLGKIPFIWGIPFIEMYGFGGTIMVYAFRRYKHRPLFVFVAGMFLMTLFELLGSYFCTLVLHRVFWDYSKEGLNFEGSISLRSAIAWGLLSVLGVKIIGPFINKIYADAQKMHHYKKITVLCMFWACLCAFIKYYILPSPG